VTKRKDDPLLDHALSRLGNAVLSYRLKCFVLLYVGLRLSGQCPNSISRFCSVWDRYCTLSGANKARSVTAAGYETLHPVESNKSPEQER
jgi:hypothetical protein